MKFNKGKRKVLHLGRNAVLLAGDWLAVKWLCRKGLEVLVDTTLNTSWQCVLVAKKVSTVLGCIRKNATSRFREVFFFPLIKLCRNHIWSAVSGSGFSSRRKTWT